MKGIVFTELLKMIEQKFGYEMVDEILLESNLPSGGIYTSIGTYNHSEIVTIVSKLSEKSNIPIEELVYTFGHHLFGVFYQVYAHFFEYVKNAFDFLNSIENYIHVEVKKIYPDAQLPHFEVIEKANDNLIMVYSSDRKMAALAHGLIDGCLNHFGEEAIIDVTTLNIDGSKVKFDIKKTK